MTVYPNYPKVQATSNNTFILLEAYKIKGIEIPAGYQTNGADIPRIFWSIVPPNKPKYQSAIILHDYLCDKEEYKKADRLMKQVLFEIDGQNIITVGMSLAVKLYHKIRYGIFKG